MTVSNFDLCLFHVLKFEGGFSNHAADRGGATNMGITQATLSAARGALVSVEDVQALSRQEAASIYRRLFWDTASLDRIQSWRVALLVFDHAVHSGPRAAIKTLQRALNSAKSGALIAEDGAMGQKTDAALCRANETLLIRRLLQERQLAFAALCQKDSSQIVFLRGWLARTHQLADTLTTAV